MPDTGKVSDKLGLTTQEDFINLTVRLNNYVFIQKILLTWVQKFGSTWRSMFRIWTFYYHAFQCYYYGFL